MKITDNQKRLIKDVLEDNIEVVHSTKKELEKLMQKASRIYDEYYNNKLPDAYYDLVDNNEKENSFYEFCEYAWENFLGGHEEGIELRQVGRSSSFQILPRSAYDIEDLYTSYKQEKNLNEFISYFAEIVLNINLELDDSSDKKIFDLEAVYEHYESIHKDIVEEALSNSDKDLVDAYFTLTEIEDRLDDFSQWGESAIKEIDADIDKAITVIDALEEFKKNSPKSFRDYLNYEGIKTNLLKDEVEKLVLPKLIEKYVKPHNHKITVPFELPDGNIIEKTVELPIQCNATPKVHQTFKSSVKNNPKITYYFTYEFDEPIATFTVKDEKITYNQPVPFECKLNKTSNTIVLSIVANTESKQFEARAVIDEGFLVNINYIYDEEQYTTNIGFNPDETKRQEIEFIIE